MKNNIYDSIGIINVINQLKIKKTNLRGNYIYAICPFCQNSEERNGHLKINTINNLYVCNECEETGTSIDLYSKLKHISTKEAFKILLKENPILDNIPSVFNNSVKDEYYRDLVYRNLLAMQNLDNIHYQKLKEMNFTDYYIKENSFKSIENGTNNKKIICEKLQKQGLRLDGIPGFFQDTDFKWTYKSHNGIFIPVIFNNKIQGLRILLDNKYGLDTQNIWFSSNNVYNGTKANNWITILKARETNWINMYNSNKNNSIIIATEIILAHKLFNKFNKTIIGIPNNASSESIMNMVNKMNVSEVILYVDEYTILHTSKAICKNIIQPLEKHGIKVDFRTSLNKNKENNNLEKFEMKIA